MIRQRVLILGLAALLPAILLTIALAVLTLTQHQERMRDNAVGYADRLLGDVEDEFRLHIALLRVLAQSPALDGERFDLALFDDVARRFVAATPGWDRVILLEGVQQVVNTHVPFGTPLPTVVDAKGLAAVHETGRPHVGGLVRGGTYSPGGNRTLVSALAAEIGAPLVSTSVTSWFRTYRDGALDDVIRAATASHAAATAYPWRPGSRPPGQAARRSRRGTTPPRRWSPSPTGAADVGGERIAPPIRHSKPNGGSPCPSSTTPHFRRDRPLPPEPETGSDRRRHGRGSLLRRLARERRS